MIQGLRKKQVLFSKNLNEVGSYDIATVGI